MRALLAAASLLASAGPSPAQSERAVVWAAGDAATPGERADRVAALVRRAGPDRFLYLGDVYETGTLKEFRRWYHPRFGRLAHITAPTIGNHEWDNRFQGYYRYWYRRKGEQLPPWFKTSIAGWEILSLNSQAPHGSRLRPGPLARAGGRGTGRLPHRVLAPSALQRGRLRRRA